LRPQTTHPSSNPLVILPSSRNTGHPMPNPVPHIDILPGVPLRKARCHEAQGPGADAFAFCVAARLNGPVLWIAPSWTPSQLNPVGYSQYADPAQLLIAHTKDHDDALAVTEEALRSGAVALVVTELTGPISLLAGRRLQLAAETGQTMGLCLIPQGAGSNAAETRWQCSPIFHPSDSTHVRWEIIKNKTGTLSAWDLRWDEKTRHMLVVSPSGNRQGTAPASA
ncbi:MAG: ImuA family protein, partial [Roseovarius sp.]